MTSQAISTTEALLGLPAHGPAAIQVAFTARDIGEAAAWAAVAGAGPFFAIGDGPVTLGESTHHGVPRAGAIRPASGSAAG